MVSIIVVIAGIGVGWMVWRRRGRRHTPAVSGIAAGMTPESLAFEAFTHGNSCLAAGQFADATAAFEQARAGSERALRDRTAGRRGPAATRRQRPGTSVATRSTLTPIRRCSRHCATPTLQPSTQ
jgi:hypothetical protein